MEGGGGKALVSQSLAARPTWGADETPPQSLWQRGTGQPVSPGPLFSPTPLASISAVSPVSPPIHPHHSSASRVLPGSVRNCSWRSRGTPKPANGKQRDAEIGTVDGKVGGKESGGAGLSIKVTWGRRGSARERAGARELEGPASVQPWKPGVRVCRNPATCSLFPLMKILRSQ